MVYGRQENNLEKQIGCVKYTLFCFNIVIWMIGTALFSLTIWIRVEPGFNEWLTILEAQNYYIGIYILMAMSIIMMAVSFLGCLSSLMENSLALFVFIGTQIFGFVLSIVGSAFLLSYSQMHSNLQPILRSSLQRFVMTSENPNSIYVLNMIQEAIGCCGIDGPNDYWDLKQPLPESCRDAVTGNAFFSGCVHGLTWFFESKSEWIVVVAMTSAMLNVITSVLSSILIQAIKKEDDEARGFRR